MNTKLNIRRRVAYRKTAISVRADILAATDKAAKGRGQSRSRYIADILEAAVQVRRDAAITHRLNQLFADDGIGKEQVQVAEELDLVGTDWHERW